MSNINRPNYTTGIELDGPYRHTSAQRVRDVLAALLHWIKS